MSNLKLLNILRSSSSCLRMRNDQFYRNCLRQIVTTSVNCTDDRIIDRDDDPSIIIPPYIPRSDEPLATKKARLLYQSRKRGMLENGLLLSTFADKYLKSMTEDQVIVYDKLINQPSNDWEIYYWATDAKETPKEFESEIMNLLKEHVKSFAQISPKRQPDLS
ncbi:succinate dehydrogenase assembly factor 2-A, mitochondrial-like [Chrysoperla carnea]|uniref:succinate dehydrogenase assembly factor 2-A, mitochondrial-like n=1 Tax=Chrysoperla carnea TaxID=189513 RepID=UPI001D064308|nr:succinate dehydrogenase assembly factor 2-A, mitochondrial-like [Chrysoperla carnea]